MQTFPRMLFVCSAGLLRSPTAAYVAANRGYNTRSAGCESYALIPVSHELISWADHIFVMSPDQLDKFKGIDKVKCLDIPDVYEYRSTKLVELIENKLTELGF